MMGAIPQTSIWTESKGAVETPWYKGNDKVFPFPIMQLEQG